MSNIYKGMGVFQEAKQRKKDGYGYRASRRKMLWQSKETSWRHLSISYGIRWSDIWQILPIWNNSHNGQRAIQFGVWKLFFEISISRKSPYPYMQKFLFINNHRVKKFYLLFF